MNEMEVHTMKCPECGKEMRDGYLFCSKDGAFSFANKVPGVFENAKNAQNICFFATNVWIYVHLHLT